jgi:hypothetical protein
MPTLESLSLLAIQTAIVTGTVILLSLPAIVELKKPKDSGPRLIKDNFERIRIGEFRNGMVNLDEEENDKLKIGLASFLCRFPNLEV